MSALSVVDVTLVMTRTISFFPSLSLCQYVVPLPFWMLFLVSCYFQFVCRSNHSCMACVCVSECLRVVPVELTRHLHKAFFCFAVDFGAHGYRLRWHIGMICHAIEPIIIVFFFYFLLFPTWITNIFQVDARARTQRQPSMWKRVTGRQSEGELNTPD